MPIGYLTKEELTTVHLTQKVKYVLRKMPNEKVFFKIVKTEGYSNIRDFFYSNYYKMKRDYGNHYDLLNEIYSLDDVDDLIDLYTKCSDLYMIKDIVEEDLMRSLATELKDKINSHEWIYLYLREIVTKEEIIKDILGFYDYYDNELPSDLKNRFKHIDFNNLQQYKGRTLRKIYEGLKPFKIIY